MRRLFLACAAVALASCTLTTGPGGISDDTDLESFQASYMTTFDIMNKSYLSDGRAFSPFTASHSSSSSKATVPVWSLPSGSLDFSDVAGGSADGSATNYPEAGQSSTWTVEETSMPRVFLVKVATTFASSDPRASQDEWYYVYSADDPWTVDDPVCDASGATDPKFRVKNELTYDDGSVQEENIIDIRWYDDHDGFADFDVTGSLDYPAGFLPVEDASASYSSVVVYTRTYSDSPSYSWWNGERIRTILGVRYYTENLSADHSTVVGSTIVFEKAVTSLYTLGGDFADEYSSLFLSTLGYEPDQAMLALTVIRQESTYAVSSYVDQGSYTVDYDDASNLSDTRAKTRVVNIDAQTDNYVTLINDEAADISDAYGTIWIPVGDDPNIVSLDSGTVIDVKTSNVLASTDGSAPIAVITDTPAGELGDLYVAVTEGTPPSAAVSNDISGDLSGSGDVKAFDGTQGFVIDGVATDYAYKQGTIQAWVYVEAVTNYGGIVHAGVRSDFIDELWTLQFWGNNNTPSFGLAAQSPYVYDMVTSSQRLNLRKWYHLAATWDLSANSMVIYVNGAAKGSRTFSNVRSSSTFASNSPVVIGSQLADVSGVLSGYYGFNGKINGVLIDGRAWSTAEISAFYEANKSKTADW